MSTSLANLTTNFFPSAQNGFTTTTSGTVASAATTVGLNSVAGFSNGQIAVFVIDPSEATKKQTFTGVIDTAGVQVTNVVWTAGTNQTHTAGATVVDYETATHWSMMTKGILVEHDQDGTHDATLIAKLAGTQTFTGAKTFSDITLNEGSVDSENLNATIACRAYRAAAVNSTSTEGDIVYDTENFDLGSDFNTTTGVFTAPLTGYYHVNTHISFTDLPDANQAILRIYANGAITAVGTAVSAGAANDPRFGVSDIVFLNAGEVIKATIQSTGTIAVAVGSTLTYITIHFIGV